MKGCNTESLVGLVVVESATDIVCSLSQPLEVELVGLEFILKSRKVIGSVVGWVGRDTGEEYQHQRADQQGFIHD